MRDHKRKNLFQACCMNVSHDHITNFIFKKKIPLTKFLVQKLIPKQRQDSSLIPNVRIHTIQKCMKTLPYESKQKKFKINYYFQPLMFDLLYPLVAASLWLFQTLISYMRWCITEEENNRELVRDEKLIFRVVASHQNHVVVIYHHFRGVLDHFRGVAGM